MNTTTTETNGFTKTHDGLLVYPAGSELPSWAHGWIQCDNRGGGYATWLDASDIELAKADAASIEAESKKLRTRKQCEAALSELGVEGGGSCSSMRLTYQITKYRDMWPLRQV